MTSPTSQPVPFRVRADLFAQLAQMEKSGLVFDRSLAILCMQKPFQARVEMLRTLLAKGLEFATAGEQSGLFSTLESRLIRVAMAAGSPVNMYQRLATYYADRARKLTAMKSRLALPASIFLLALIVQPIPALIGGSLSLAGYGWEVIRPIALIIILIYAIRFLIRINSRATGKSFYQRVPLYGPIFVKQNLRDVFSSLALLLEAGVSMADAWSTALDTAEDDDIRRELGKVRPKVARGASLTDALHGVRYVMDERLIQFVRTGEASGKLPEMLLRHTQMETDDINSLLRQLAMWVPRAVYALVACWMAYWLVTSGGFMPKME